MWAIILIFGLLLVIGIGYVLLHRPQDRVRESAATGDLTEAGERTLARAREGAGSCTPPAG